MKVANHEDAEQIAKIYCEKLGLKTFVVDGSELDDTEDGKPTWRVYLSFSAELANYVGLPNFLIVDVDALTGEASDTPTL